MARPGTDLSSHLPMHSGNAVQIPTSLSGVHSPNMPIGSDTEAGSNPALSPTESRIPRPSPTALRRSASLRLRGERGSHLRSPIISSTIHNHQIRNRSNHYNNHHQQQLQSNQQDPFPVINENGVDSPRHRSFVSYKYLLTFFFISNINYNFVFYILDRLLVYFSSKIHIIFNN